jgi:hypothetical protein
MCDTNKPALRAAVLIHEQLAGRSFQANSLYLPEHSWNHIQRVRRHIQKAHTRGWFRAVEVLGNDLANALRSFQHEVENVVHTLATHTQSRTPVSPSDIYRDILAIGREFDGVGVNFPLHELVVTTDDIELEHIYLGRFDIRLDWQRLGESSAYRVVALDPHPAAKSEDITHPHVQDEQLCEGEGRAAIRAALLECRLYDFFLLVSQLLHTYGRGSAYVELNNWSGVPCDDCGTSTAEGDRCYCNHCDSVLCDSCASTCEGCDATHCSECLGRCVGCGCSYCAACLATCPVCHKHFCENCREGRLCNSCFEKQHNEEKDDDEPHNDSSRPAGGRSQPSETAVCIPA